MAINGTFSLDSANRLLRSAAATDKPATGTYAEFLLTLEVAMTEEVTARPQTLEDVKREFHDFLDSLALSPGLSGTPISVTITDAAFEKMLADPEYKQKMKDLCVRDLCDPSWSRMAGMGLSPSAIVVTIDPNSKEEYLASSYNSPSARGKADGDAFWSRRTKNNKAARKAQEKRDAEKRETLKFLRELAAERKGFADALFSPESATLDLSAAAPGGA